MGNWFANFIGYWFGGAPPITASDSVCNPTLRIEQDILTCVPETEMLTYTIQDC